MSNHQAFCHHPYWGLVIQKEMLQCVLKANDAWIEVRWIKEKTSLCRQCNERDEINVLRGVYMMKSKGPRTELRWTPHQPAARRKLSYLTRKELISKIWTSLERSHESQSIKVTDQWLQCRGRWYQKLQLKLGNYECKITYIVAVCARKCRPISRKDEKENAYSYQGLLHAAYIEVYKVFA